MPPFSYTIKSNLQLKIKEMKINSNNNTSGAKQKQWPTKAITVWSPNLFLKVGSLQCTRKHTNASICVAP